MVEPRPGVEASATTLSRSMSRAETLQPHALTTSRTFPEHYGEPGWVQSGPNPDGQFSGQLRSKLRPFESAGNTPVKKNNT